MVIYDLRRVKLNKFMDAKIIIKNYNDKRHTGEVSIAYVIAMDIMFIYSYLYIFNNEWFL